MQLSLDEKFWFTKEFLFRRQNVLQPEFLSKRNFEQIIFLVYFFDSGSFKCNPHFLKLTGSFASKEVLLSGLLFILNNHPGFGKWRISFTYLFRAIDDPTLKKINVFFDPLVKKNELWEISKSSFLTNRVSN